MIPSIGMILFQVIYIYIFFFVSFICQTKGKYCIYSLMGYLFIVSKVIIKILCVMHLIRVLYFVYLKEDYIQKQPKTI